MSVAQAIGTFWLIPAQLQLAHIFSCASGEVIIRERGLPLHMKTILPSQQFGGFAGNITLYPLLRGQQMAC